VCVCVCVGVCCGMVAVILGALDASNSHCASKQCLGDGIMTWAVRWRLLLAVGVELKEPTSRTAKQLYTCQRARASLMNSNGERRQQQQQDLHMKE
jgi:hypothetical protein